MVDADFQEDMGFNDVLRDLEDNIFGIDPDKPTDKSEKDEEEIHEELDGKKSKPKKRKETLPLLVDQDAAQNILKDFMKEKNQKKYDVVGFELYFRPYWLFTYTCELMIKDKDGNIIDSEEVGSRVAIDAESGALADYLEETLENEPIETVDLVDQVAEEGGNAKVIEAKIKESKLEHFLTQKISGALRAEKDNVSVAGFELLWSPVWKGWMDIKKRTHNLQIDGCQGYPINYDNIPQRPKTWEDILMEDISMLKNPKKWSEFIKKRGKRRSSTPGASKGLSGMNWFLVEIVLGLALFGVFIYGLYSSAWDLLLIGIGGLIILFWYMNHRRSKQKAPMVPLPPPPGAGYVEP